MLTRRKGQTPLIILICLLGYFAACTKVPLLSDSTANTVLRLHGSNTIGAELAPALVEGYLRKSGAKNIEKINGSVSDEVIIQAVLPGQSTASKVEIKAHGSDTAVKALENEECDIGMLSRKLKSEEVQLLAAFGDMKSRGSENVIAMDGIAVIVNKSNPIQELSVHQIAQIFTGEITEWSNVDERVRGEINVYARDDKSGTFDTFKSLVLGKDKKLVKTAKRIEDSRELSDAVASDANGIGFAGLPYVGNTASVAVYEEGLQPLRPSAKSINARTYLLYRELYFYLPQKNSNKMARELVAFALSDEGQDIVKEVGFVSQALDTPDRTPKPVEAIRRGDIPSELAKIKDSYKECPTVFYFKSGSDELDNKSLDDFDRTERFFGRESVKEIILVGFADNTGTAAQNLELSKRRAESVAKAFKRVGREPDTVTGFGQEAPIRKNDTVEGRDKNRRVEIYYK